MTFVTLNREQFEQMLDELPLHHFEPARVWNKNKIKAQILAYVDTQEPPAETTRVWELARVGAKTLHYRGWNKHDCQPFSTCPHPDCTAVRRKP